MPFAALPLAQTSLLSAATALAPHAGRCRVWSAAESHAWPMRAVTAGACWRRRPVWDAPPTGSIAGVRGPRAVRWVAAAAAVRSLAGAYPCARLMLILPHGFTLLT